MTAITEFLFPAPARRSPVAILRWWESRRLVYNAIVGGAGLLSLGAVALIGALPPDAEGLRIPLAAVLVVGVLANVCYCMGPLSEIAIEKLGAGKVLPTGPALYRMGLTFSTGLVLLPTMLAGFDWVFRLIRAIL